MANIQFGKYIMKPQGSQFDLYKKVIREKEKTKEKYEFEQIVGYGMKFENCLDTIAKDKLEEIPDILSIPNWINQYKKIKDELLNSLK